jgi:hypothetical protein
VAYVRFASVYRKFEDVEEFERELERLESEPPLQREHLFEPSRDDVRGGERKAGSVRPGPQATRLPRESGDEPAKGALAGLTEGNS